MQITESLRAQEEVRATPAVSWLLCTHMVDEQLRLALQSCLEQTFSDFELLIVANGTAAGWVADRVAQWVGHDDRVRVFKTEVRYLPFSLSLGLHHARAPLVARMDSDDLSKPDRLQQQVDYFRTHPEVAVLGTAYEVIDSAGKVLHTVQLPQSNTDIRHAMRIRNPLCHPSVMFRREIVLDAGAYIGGLLAEDYDLWVRLAADPNVKFANLSAICLSYRDVGVGGGRGARAAYAAVAAAQLREFLLGGGLSWLGGAFLSIFKSIVRSRPRQAAPRE
ncbi:MAG: glycosyltransferase [Undibacterium sp.]|uniref:glycosyltransferase n=1 Tax=Undibacterium sp. TaxID=1914977 RepID=UPI002728AA31|nr:glycosyltransferase [Undibacterium sp.]MDO8652449.1 glycosyltransferase [Undibacterium sp.]